VPIPSAPPRAPSERPALRLPERERADRAALLVDREQAFDGDVDAPGLRELLIEAVGHDVARVPALALPHPRGLGLVGGLDVALAGQLLLELDDPHVLGVELTDVVLPLAVDLAALQHLLDHELALLDRERHPAKVLGTERSLEQRPDLRIMSEIGPLHRRPVT